jgi:hypothetical protein
LGRTNRRFVDESRPGSERTIAGLAEIIDDLPEDERELFHRIFHVSVTMGELTAPPTMYQWIERQFGSVQAVETQKIVRVTNLVTMEGSLFNELRAMRPMEAKVSGTLDEEIARTEGDPFCTPEKLTPEDVFGRVRGEVSVSASNIAKYDGFHGVIISDLHNPLKVTQPLVSDYIDVGWEWAQRAREVDPEAKYFFFLWNSLWKAGASIPHGHAQVTLGRDMHYARVEARRRAALHYNTDYRSNYFEDMVKVHRSLGLVVDWREVAIVANLTPIKEKEVVIVGKALDGAMKQAIYEVLNCFINQLGVAAFNVAIMMPPLAETTEDWSGFPVMVHLVDRGDPGNRTVDFAAMEMYASSVISSDPFRLAKILRDCLSIKPVRD